MKDNIRLIKAVQNGKNGKKTNNSIVLISNHKLDLKKGNNSNWQQVTTKVNLDDVVT